MTHDNRVSQAQRQIFVRPSRALTNAAILFALLSACRDQLPTGVSTTQPADPLSSIYTYEETGPYFVTGVTGSPMDLCWAIHDPNEMFLDGGCSDSETYDPPKVVGFYEVFEYGDPWDETWLTLWIVEPEYMVNMECSPLSLTAQSDDVYCSVGTGSEYFIFDSASVYVVPIYEDGTDMTPVLFGQVGPTDEFTNFGASDGGEAYLQSVYGAGYIKAVGSVQGGAFEITRDYSATKRQAQVAWTGSGCGGAAVRGATRTCTITPRDSSLRLTNITWSFIPDSSTVSTHTRGTIGGPVASSSWSGSVVASGRMRAVATVTSAAGNINVDTTSAALGVTARAASSMGTMSFTLHNTTLNVTPVTLPIHLGYTTNVISFTATEAGEAIADDGPNNGYWWYSTLSNLVWVDTTLINYPQMLENSNFWTRHAASPPSGICSRSFVAGTGENHLKRRIEKHEGTNVDAGSHVEWARDTVTSLMTTIQQRFERTLAGTNLSHSQWMSRLLNVTYAQFHTIDTTRNDPIDPPLGCLLIYTP